MILALLAVLGVNLIVVAVLLAGVLSRKRWVRRQPGAFRGAIRIASGDIDGLHGKWRRGYGRWVRDVLVWTKSPLLLRNEILAIDGIDGERSETGDGVKRLGDEPIVLRLRVGRATVAVAVAAEDRAVLLEPYGKEAAPNQIPGAHQPKPPERIS